MVVRGKLYLVGVGLAPDLITLRGLGIARRADKLLVDSYTSATPEGLEGVEKVIGRPLEPVGRSGLEGKAEVIMEYLERGLSVALLVVGDPLVATTHVSLLLDARRRGFECEVVPAPGILPNALTLSGLMVYKMGKVATVTYPVDGKLSFYPYDVVKDNDSRNLHTVLLLEMDAERGVMMSVSDAVRLLEKMEEVRGEGVFPPTRKIIAVSALATSKQRICYAPLKELRRYAYEYGPHTLVVPSPKLHFVEEDALKILAGECGE